MKTVYTYDDYLKRLDIPGMDANKPLPDSYESNPYIDKVIKEYPNHEVTTISIEGENGEFWLDVLVRQFKIKKDEAVIMATPPNELLLFTNATDEDAFFVFYNDSTQEITFKEVRPEDKETKSDD